MKSIIATAVILSSCLLSANGQNFFEPIRNADTDNHGKITTGFTSVYYMHGMVMAEESLWVDIEYTLHCTPVPVTFGAMYLNAYNSSFDLDQLDLYARAEIGTLLGFETHIGYTHHIQPMDDSFHIPYGEISLDLRRDLGFAELILSSNYMTGDGDKLSQHTSSGWYHEIALEKSYKLCERSNLVITGGVGYLDGLIDNPNNGQEGTGWNHGFLNLSVPVNINTQFTLTPFIGYRTNVILSDSTDSFSNDRFHGGISLSYSF